MKKDILGKIRHCHMLMMNRKSKPPTQLRILNEIYLHSPVTPKELLAKYDMSAPSLSEIITKLEKKECIIRVRENSDKRKVTLYPTEKGVELAKQGINHREKLIEESLSCLNDKEADTLYELLSKLEEDWVERYG